MEAVVYSDSYYGFVMIEQYRFYLSIPINHLYYTLITSDQVSNYEEYQCPYSYCHDLASQNDYPLVKVSVSPLAFY